MVSHMHEKPLKRLIVGSIHGHRAEAPVLMRGVATGLISNVALAAWGRDAGRLFKWVQQFFIRHEKPLKRLIVGSIHRHRAEAAVLMRGAATGLISNVALAWGRDARRLFKWVQQFVTRREKPLK